MSRRRRYDVYYDHIWREARAEYLCRNPLCSYCEKQGKVEAATVVDHIRPHKGDYSLFWDEGNWQPLCSICHASAKQRADISGKQVYTGEDGWPIHEQLY